MLSKLKDIYWTDCVLKILQTLLAPEHTVQFLYKFRIFQI